MLSIKDIESKVGGYIWVCRVNIGYLDYENNVVKPLKVLVRNNPARRTYLNGKIISLELVGVSNTGKLLKSKTFTPDIVFCSEDEYTCRLIFTKKVEDTIQEIQRIKQIRANALDDKINKLLNFKDLSKNK